MGTNISQTSTDSKTPPATNKTSTDSKTLPATNKTSTDSKTPAMSKELNTQHDMKTREEITRQCRDVKRMIQCRNGREKEEKAELKRKISDLETIESKRIKKDEIKRQEEEELIKRRVRIEEVERMRT
uniref:Uncharacterized protein n=1 Tax=Amphimedon queenslandica TaxID=400682 RepID=A0A1X7T4V1_AMPQE